jgi:hypothetical protein
MKHQKKIEAFAQRELATLIDNLIVSEGNQYFLFGLYELEKSPHSVSVADKNNFIGVFSSTKTAVAWCIADKLNQLNIARRIQQLDNEYIRHTDDINIKRRLVSQSHDWDFKDTVSVKISMQQAQRQAIEAELTKCVNVTKYWQYRGFNNETQRISRAPTY